ncbi:MAG: acyltransferase domain-containing protein [Deltaproteobacteria bacterium]|nr:MAG: acyltransferase domain-containing protein [Deltaproteobacteria bacterium]
MSTRTLEPIAIVGMAALFPKSPDLASYWANIVAGADCISDVPQDHSWSPEDYNDEDPTQPDVTWAQRGGFLEKVPFDPVKWGIPPTQLEAIDSSQLLGLMVAREALKDAGLDPDASDWDRERTSCILGVTGTQEMVVTAGARIQGPRWKKALRRHGIDATTAEAISRDISAHFPEWTEQTFPGLLGNVVAGRIANRLDLGGTNCVVDAACASSLAAVQFAMSALRDRSTDIALTGGVDTLNDIFMHMCFSKTPALSKGNEARPFDARADGILLGEGVSMLACKRLSDAERDGDRIYAVITGMGSSSDGRSRSIYAPDPGGQAKAIRRAYEAAGISADSIELIEAHGTGTKAGDAAEVEGLKLAFSEVEREGRFVALGSVKSQVGHTKGAAGAAGLMKAALALYQRVLPPTAKVEVPNPKADFENTPLYVNQTARPWVKTGETPRRAGVSSFGFGGSNFHTVLEEYGSDVDFAVMGPADAELFLFGGKDAAELGKALDAVDLDAPTLAHAAHAVLKAWKPAQHVLAFVVDSGDALKAALADAKALIAAGPGTRGDVTYATPEAARLAVLFPGQGSQYPDMARSALVRHPAARATVDRADAALRNAGRPGLAARIYPPSAFSPAESKAQRTALTATEWAQPAIGAISMALWNTLSAYGVTAEAFAGHSYGELVALAAAGAYDEDTLWTLSRVRGEAMAGDADRGTMAAVKGDLDAIEQVLAGLSDGVVLANRNHPTQGVISGSREGIERALKALEAAGLSGRPISVSAAFHSPLVADAAEPLAAALAEAELALPATDVYANSTGAVYDDVAKRLVEQITSPVRFVDTLQALWDRGIRTFVECGPKGVLSGLVNKTLPEATMLATDAATDSVDGDTQLKNLLASLAVAGVAIDVAPLLAQRLPEAPRMPTSPATVWIGGANHRTERTLNPPLPTSATELNLAARLEALEKKAAEAEARAEAAERRAIAAESAPKPVAQAIPAAASHTPAPGALGGLLAATRESLAAFTANQEQAAQVHREFLRAHATATETFAKLFESHARLVGSAQGMDVSQLPVAAPAPVAVPAPVMPEPVLPAPIVPPAMTASSLGSGFSRSQIVPDVPASDADSAAAAEMGGWGLLKTSDKIASVKPEPVTNGAPAPTIRLAGSGNSAIPELPTAATYNRSGAKAAPVAETAGFSEKQLTDALLAAVAEKTGYPVEMLDLAMDLESDLGIDSIKRVEILASVQEALPGLPDVDNDTLAALRGLGDVRDHLLKIAPTGGSSAPAGPVFTEAALKQALLASVAEKTGYPVEMLDLAMDLESDLGIDSIKRVEILASVQEALPGLPDVDNDTLAALRGLGDVLNHLVEIAPTGGAVPAPTAAFSESALHDALLAAVADKTGYPVEMLDLAMDLESDLGIDSIKRVEILAAVQETLPGLPDVDNDTLAALRSLGDVKQHLVELTGGAPTPAAEPAPVAVPEIPVVDLAALAPVETLVPTPKRRTVRVLEAPNGTPFRPGGVLALTRDAHGLAEGVAKALSAQGVDAVVIDDEVPADAVGLVHVAAVGASDVRAEVRRAFTLAKAIGPCALFATVSAQGGRFGLSHRTGDYLQGALAGLPKTLAQEWEDTRCLALDVDPAALDAEAVARELLTDRGVLEIGLPADGPVALFAAVDPLEDAIRTSPLEPGDLVVVTGGARGVTAAVVIELAKRHQPTLLLLGRSALAELDPGWAIDVDDAGLKAAYLGFAKTLGSMPKPAELNREVNKVLRAREVRKNLAAMESHGSKVHYAAVDARDREAIGEVLARFDQPVKGFVHGAGVLQDKLLVDKSEEQFDLVFSTKVDGLEAVLAHVDTAELKLVAMFGSVAGRYGNRGQADYSMANEALCAKARELAAQGVLAKCFSWGPWDGGMVDASLAKQFASRGIDLIGLQAGAESFCDEFSLGSLDASVEVVIGGPDVPGPLVSSKPTNVKAISLTSEDGRFLTDHKIDGKAVLPAVMVLEWMAKTAREAFPALHVTDIRDFAVLKGVVVDSDAELKLTWEVVDAVAKGATALSFQLLGAANAMGLPALHYKGTVELGPERPKTSPFPGSNGLGKHRYPHALDEAYKNFLFHGPALRGITQVVGVSDHGIVAKLASSEPKALDVDGEAWETDPVVLDSALQCMVLWVRENKGASALPCYVENYRQYGPFKGEVTVHMDFKPSKTARGRFEATLVGEDGEVVATMSGAEYTANPSLNPVFRADA